MLEIVISFFLLVGAFFILVGAIGLARLPDIFMRLHAPTKSSTLGVGGVLLASMVYAFNDTFLIHEFIITIFIFVTAPVGAHLLAQAALRLKLKSKAKLP
jgi:multicomponent K+:H+ antiporter subunit G